MGKQLIDQFNKLYPGHAAQKCSVDGYTLHETQNENIPHKFQYLTITGFEGWQLPPAIAKDSSSLHHKTQQGANKLSCHELMTTDCDGLLCQVTDSNLDFYIFELKSSYNKDSIVKAKNQVIGSMLKLRWLMSLLQRFEGVNIRAKGIITAYEASTEQLNYIRDLTDKGAIFARRLHDEGIYHILSARSAAYWHPLYCPDIDIQLIKVPRHQTTHTIDFASIKLTAKE